ncbi:M3 family metallopeptidase [Akkermansiaceae bacterium]|nr:M3 family metallopeptidase [Akkermansiaceae bacterium]
MSDTHPFLADEFKIRWSTLTPEHIEADVTQAIETGRTNIEAIKTLPLGEVTYENTFAALEIATEDLDRSWGRVNHLDSVANSDDLRAALHKMLPLVSEFSSSISLDGDLWKRIKACEEGDLSTLSEIEKRFVAETCNDFRSAGADLDDTAKKRMAEINAELATITQKFGENVLDSTNAWDLFIEDESRLAGLPDSAKAAAAEDAKSKDKEGQWRITLHAPSMMPVMQYAEDDSLRKEIWQASSEIGRGGEHDNSQLIWDILALREEKAALLGFSNFADLTLARRMAGSGKGAIDFSENLHALIVDRFQEEVAELQSYKAEKTGGENAKLEPWETGYWAETRRKELFAFDEEALRPYFPVGQVMDGLFSLTSTLFGITISESEAEAWHEEVTFYEIHDAKTKEHLGSFYADWHPRESKRGGAWMNYLETGLPSPRTPHLGLICGNMTKPTEDKPALLTHREVETVFHEFGHLLHHLLSDVSIKSLAGVNVPWDFVELPSQIMENFCWDRQSLDLFATHYETGETIPDELFEKMIAARNYMSASGFMRQLSLGMLDLALHSDLEKYRGRDLDDVDREILANYKAPLATETPSIARRFSHLFSSPVGYAAGYYSYKWAEVLDADAFTRFRKEGILNTETGASFRKEILAQGNSRPVDESYRAFMGRDPEQAALLDRSGL